MRAWLNVATRRPFYDQPDVVVAAIEDVAQGRRLFLARDTSFYGGHRWGIAPLSILESTGNYRGSLLEDMRRRSPDVLKRLVGVMAESSRGRAALFDGRDRTFHEALVARLGDAATADALLQRVQERVVEPYEGMRGTSGQLLRDLRDRGFYLPPDTATSP